MRTSPVSNSCSAIPGRASCKRHRFPVAGVGRTLLSVAFDSVPRSEKAKPKATATDKSVRSTHLLRVVHQFPAYPRLQHFDISNLHRIDVEYVVAQQHHIGELAGSDRAFHGVLEFRVG